jgi:ComF family protein
LIKDFISLVYSDLCAGCKETLTTFEKGICSGCWVDLKVFNNRKSFLYFGRFKVENEFYAFEFVKNQVLQKVIHNIKYDNNKNAAYVLGVELGKIILSNTKNIDAIVPVPISRKKRRERGYNQCDYIAKGIQQVVKKPILFNYFKRTNALNSQIKSNRFQRWDNIKGQFLLGSNELNPKGILLVDDVVSSRATIYGCLEAIQNKDLKISVAALAANSKDLL